MHFFFLLINFHILLKLLVWYCGCFRIVRDLLCLCSVLGACTHYIFHYFGSALRMLPESYLYFVFSYHLSLSTFPPFHKLQPCISYKCSYHCDCSYEFKNNCHSLISISSLYGSGNGIHAITSKGITFPSASFHVSPSYPTKSGYITPNGSP